MIFYFISAATLFGSFCGWTVCHKIWWPFFFQSSMFILPFRTKKSKIKLFVVQLLVLLPKLSKSIAVLMEYFFTAKLKIGFLIFISANFRIQSIGNNNVVIRIRKKIADILSPSNYFYKFLLKPRKKWIPTPAKKI